MLHISYHARMQYSIRAGVPFWKTLFVLQPLLEGAQEVSQIEAVTNFPITRIQKNDRYLRWADPTIREDMLALVREDTVVTVLTTQVFNSTKHKMPHRQYTVEDGKITTQNPWFIRKGGVKYR